jgi:broad specificity phosphatase PhoE
MKKLLYILFLCTACNTGEAQTTTFILLRHAEKDNDGTQDPPLTKEGYARAEKIARMLRETEVQAIYTTKYKRTGLTVAPLAQAKGITVEEYEAFKAEEIGRMIETHRGGTVVISGHSNNIPWIANLLLGKEQVKEYDESDYDNMLIVSVVEKGDVKVTWLEY